MNKIIFISLPLIIALMPFNLEANIVVSAGLPSSSYTDDMGGNDWLGGGGGNAENFFNGSLWNSGHGGDAWVQVDLGSIQTISEIVYYTNQTPDGVVSQNIYVSDNDISNNFNNLIPVASFNGYAVMWTQIDLIFAPVSGRYVEILANGGPSWTALGNGSVITSAVSVPSAVWLFLTGLGLISFKRKLKKI